MPYKKEDPLLTMPLAYHVVQERRPLSYHAPWLPCRTRKKTPSFLKIRGLFCWHGRWLSAMQLTQCARVIGLLCCLTDPAPPAMNESQGEGNVLDVFPPGLAEVVSFPSGVPVGRELLATPSLFCAPAVSIADDVMVFKVVQDVPAGRQQHTTQHQKKRI